MEETMKNQFFVGACLTFAAIIAMNFAGDFPPHVATAVYLGSVVVGGIGVVWMGKQLFGGSDQPIG